MNTWRKMALDKKINNLIKVAKKLDESGNFKLSDKIDNLIKISQAVGIQTPVNYKSVRPIDTPATGFFQNLGDTSFGYYLAGGQYDAQAPGKFSGPNAPLVQTTLTPTQYAEMERNNPEGLARIQMLEGLRAQQYLAESGATFANLGRIISQWLGPDVPSQRQEAFKSFVLPNVMSSTISTILSNYPVSQWEKKLDDLENTAIQTSPRHASVISDAIKVAVKKTLEEIKFRNAAKYKDLIKSPQYRTFASTYNIR